MLKKPVQRRGFHLEVPGAMPRSQELANKFLHFPGDFSLAVLTPSVRFGRGAAGIPLRVALF